MGNSIPPGPYKCVQTTDPNRPAPWYIMPFDKGGTCTAPLTREHLVKSVSEKTFTDVYLFSHGWNNDWDDTSKRYEDFITGFLEMRAQYGLSLEREYRPLLVGVFWPSTALVAPWERAPKFAGAPAGGNSAIDDWRRELEDLAQEIDAANRQAFYELAQKDNLSEEEALRLAEIIARAAQRFDAADTEIDASKDPVSAKELLQRAKRVPGAAGTGRKPGEFGFAGGVSAGPQAAFGLRDLDPRNLVRIATVLQMKDRAARVGATGVGPLLRDILEAHPDTRVHLVGHSYGAIVALSTICYGELPAKVDSVLLLQPAVSQWCFAADVAGKGFAGGYRPAFTRVRTPIFTTFTRHDSPLTKFFHLAVRRDKDLGQVQIASGGLPQAPSVYAALGGFGPAGLPATELQVLDLAGPNTPFPLNKPAPKVCALNGNALISGHGEVNVPATWWSLYQQVATA
jgi:heme-degrading monooxygenase HmoA